MASRVEVEGGLVTVHVDERVEQVRWDELVGVAIQTTDAGPFLDDLFWILGREDDTTVVIPSGAEGMDRLLEQLQTLPGFDNAAVIEATTSMEDNTFLCWRR